MLQTNGMMEKARGCSSFSGTNSATIVLMMPTFPLLPPIIALTAIAIGRLVAMPHIKKRNMVEARPIRMIGFLPKVSEALPHGTAVRLCDTENTAPVMPAHLATSFFSTPKLLIISGR